MLFDLQTATVIAVGVSGVSVFATKSGGGKWEMSVAAIISWLLVGFTAVYTKFGGFSFEFLPITFGHGHFGILVTSDYTQLILVGITAIFMAGAFLERANFT